MKLTKRLECEVARVVDEDGLQWLRLAIDVGQVWYEPHMIGFTIVSDEKADDLEAAYRKMLS